LLKLLRVTAPEESVGALEKGNPSLLQALGQPIVLVQVDTGGKGEVRADEHEHVAPGPIMDVEVVLVHPAHLVFEMPLVGGSLADADKDAGGLTGFENSDDLIGLGASEVGRNEIIASPFGSIQDRYTPLLGGVPDPVVKRGGNVPEDLAAHRIKLAVAPEEAHHAFGLLKRLNGRVQQNTVKAPVMKSDVILVVFVEGVQGFLQDCEISRRINPGRLCGHRAQGEGAAARFHGKFFIAGSEDRATLRSDLSAAASDHTDGQGLRALPFLVSAYPVVPQAINLN
jgi:hypothetical protein